MARAHRRFGNSVQKLTLLIRNDPNPVTLWNKHKRRTIAILNPIAMRAHLECQWASLARDAQCTMSSNLSRSLAMSQYNMTESTPHHTNCKKKMTGDVLLQLGCLCRRLLGHGVEFGEVLLKISGTHPQHPGVGKASKHFAARCHCQLKHAFSLV